MFAEELWQRIKQAAGHVQGLLERGGGNRALGLNERLRFLRYDPGCFFASHMDGTFVRGGEAGPARRGEKSLVTCQLYLNEGFRGGATRFSDWRDEAARYFDVVPRTGSVLLFEHRLNHEGCLLEIGRKYVIRTDVMYTNRDGDDLEYSKTPILPPAARE